MEPVEALRRIAFLLEASEAPTYKVRAFRNAAGTIASLDRSEVVRLHESKRLEDLEGIGKSTATVIAEALSGESPRYLAALEEERSPGPDDETARSLLEALRGDCHSHSDWSDGGSPIDEMARSAAELGRCYQALTDHSPRLTIAHGLSADDLRRQLEAVASVNDELAPFRLLTGIEVDIFEDGRLDQDENLLAQLDVVVASVHSKLRMERPQMTERMLAAVENPNVDILGHCTGRIVRGRGRAESSFDHEAVFEACARTATAVEINSRPDRLDPRKELVQLALSLGCLFSIDSDAHAPGQLTWLEYGCRIAADAGVRTDSVVNTLDLESFLAWTAGHD
ncbi:MAG: PHP domain-containing protein [Acidimicrobiales bacterium]